MGTFWVFFSDASITSALMILPSGPVPFNPWRLTPLCSATFFANGDAFSLPPAIAASGSDEGLSLVVGHVLLSSLIYTGFGWASAVGAASPSGL